MGYVIGTDEAGYGPNLGPLIISASVWRVPGLPSKCDLYRLLAAAVTNCPAVLKDKPGSPRVLLADSTVLYKAGQGLGRLEQGVLAALGAAGHRPGTWLELWELLTPDSTSQRQAEPWYADYHSVLPLEVDPDELAAAINLLSEVFTNSKACLIRIRSRAVFPQQFNELTERYGSKGAALSELTLGLVVEMLAGLDEDAPVLVICDKHGGRNRYGPLLQRHLPDWLVEICAEGRQESVYRWGPRRRRVEFCFRCRAEAVLPAAVASMASKYLRELAMRAFNQFWCQRVADLQPTAGYPGDARRFKQAIAATQAELGFDDRMLWREK